MKYMKDYDKNNESSYLQYWDVNSLYGWEKASTPYFDKDFINNYNEESDKGYFLEVDDQYPQKLHSLHND